MAFNCPLLNLRKLFLLVERDTVSLTIHDTSYPAYGEAFEVIYGSKGNLLGFQMNFHLPLEEEDFPGYDINERFDVEGTELRNLPIKEIAIIVYEAYQRNSRAIYRCAIECPEEEYSKATGILLRDLKNTYGKAEEGDL